MLQTKTKPVIGIVPGFDEGAHFYDKGIPDVGVRRIFIRLEYTEVLAAVGAIPIMLHPQMSVEQITQLCDGIIISGGEDIDPRLYGQEPIEQPKWRDLEPTSRFEWETRLIKACDTTNIPILGICYGLQRLNVYYGGTLLQDLEVLRPDNIGHDKTKHEIKIMGTFLNMKGIKKIESRHHQAIDQLAEGFEVRADAADGIIEAISGRGHFGMQWHPESDETGAHVYRAFVEHCISLEKK